MEQKVILVGGLKPKPKKCLPSIAIDWVDKSFLKRGWFEKVSMKTPSSECVDYIILPG